MGAIIACAARRSRMAIILRWVVGKPYLAIISESPVTRDDPRMKNRSPLSDRSPGAVFELAWSLGDTNLITNS